MEACISKEVLTMNALLFVECHKSIVWKQVLIKVLIKVHIKVLISCHKLTPALCSHSAIADPNRNDDLPPRPTTSRGRPSSSSRTQSAFVTEMATSSTAPGRMPAYSSVEGAQVCRKTSHAMHGTGMHKGWSFFYDRTSDCMPAYSSVEGG